MVASVKQLPSACVPATPLAGDCDVAPLAAGAPWCARRIKQDGLQAWRIERYFPLHPGTPASICCCAGPQRGTTGLSRPEQVVGRRSRRGGEMDHFHC